jgi:hypothetical protein
LFTVVPFTCTFDRMIDCVTWRKQGLFCEIWQCKLSEIRAVEVILKRKNDYVLQLKLKTGEVFIIHRYVHDREAMKESRIITHFLGL